MIRLLTVLAASLTLSACGTCDQSKMHVGMSKDEVRQACGNPDDANYITGKVSSWFYYGSGDYITFDYNGRVKYWIFDR
jgi:outer membrane protein assembly factor BamE (lipoprotein component of BamABCDE complex)